MRILGIETSCDDTGLAIYDSQKGLIAHKTQNQINTHSSFGGIVPELASRDHIKNIAPLLTSLFDISQTDYRSITNIAYTTGPGLMGSLLVGVTFAKALGLAWQIPTIGIHHIEGHLLAPMLETPAPKPPFVALIVSGGHTQLIAVTDIGEYKLLGESLDDAAGEAFDKIAKLLDIGYPGGPALAKLATKGSPNKFIFPKPMLQKPGLNFSFSGLKTKVAQTISKLELSEQTKADIAWAAEEAITTTLVSKSKRAIEATGYNSLVISGGVSANLILRKKVTAMMNTLGGKTFYPRLELCTDNGAMIAYTGYARLKKGLPNKNWPIKARWPITEL